VLLSLREFQDGKADVIVKYTADEARNRASPVLAILPHLLGTYHCDSCYTVKAYGELPENAKINETDAFGEEDGECAFEFGDEGEVDIDDI
jgi:translation initiation factor 1A